MPEDTKKELILMLKEDQLALKDFYAGKISRESLIKKATEHTTKVIEIFKEFGIARIDSDGEEAYKAMLVLILHSGDIESMQKYLGELKSLGEKSAHPQDRAFVIDKICVLSNKPQVYGTQFRKNEKGEMEPLPIEDEANIDKRRQEIGLKPLTECTNEMKGKTG